MQLDFHILFLLIRKFQVNTKVMGKNFNDTYHVIHCTSEAQFINLCPRPQSDAIHLVQRYIGSVWARAETPYPSAAGSVCTQCPASAVESCGAWSAWDAYLDKVKVDSMQLASISHQCAVKCHACMHAGYLNSLNILQMYEFIINSILRLLR